jgi:hypothetical protein
MTSAPIGVTWQNPIARKKQEISMKLWIVVLAAFVIAGAGFGPVSCADELTVGVPRDAKFVLQLDLQAFRATALGGKLFEIAREKARQELSAGGGHANHPDFDKIHEMLGFDPLAEIQAISVTGSNYDRPEQSAVVSIRMRKSTGNLEGLILALPGYETKEYGKYTIHSATPEDVRVYGVIHTDAKGDKTVVLSAQCESVTQALDHLDGKRAGDGSFKTIKLTTEGKPIVALEVLEIPTEMIKDGPQLGIVKVIRTVSVRVGELKGDLTIGISLTAATDQQAEQLRQMAQGLIAMVEFAISSNPEDEDLKKLQKFARDIKATRDGLSLKVSLSLPVDELSKIIDEQLGDH